MLVLHLHPTNLHREMIYLTHQMSRQDLKLVQLDLMEGLKRPLLIVHMQPRSQVR